MVSFQSNLDHLDNELPANETSAAVIGDIVQVN